MNSLTKNTALASALLAASVLVGSAKIQAQEVAMVYAANVTATNSLSSIDSTLTPERLAQEFSKELTAELDVRLPKEQAELSDSLQIKVDYTTSIREELDVRLIEEIRNFTASVNW